MTNSFQIRILVLSREVGYYFWVRMNLEENRKWQNIFRKIFFTGQNLKHVHITYSFLELLIIFWFTLERWLKTDMFLFLILFIFYFLLLFLFYIFIFFILFILFLFLFCSFSWIKFSYSFFSFIHLFFSFHFVF